MAKDEKKKAYDPVEKVERMNRIFDQLVLPIIVFTVVMAVISGFIFKPAGCAENLAADLAPVEEITPVPDPYLMRKILLEDTGSNRTIFEQGGYTVVETEQSGFVAYCQLDEYTQIFDGITDSSGNRYSAVMYENGSLDVTIRIYSDTVFLVEANNGAQSASAIFRDDSFAAWTSGSDADAASVLSLADAQLLTDLAGQYKAKIISLVSGE